MPGGYGRKVTSPAPAVVARGVTKRFGSLVAVDAMSLRIEPSESFGFLGPNGAGKTSAMRMIATISPVTAGQLEVLGRDAERAGPSIRARLGIVPQEDTLDLELTVRQNLVMYGRYFDLTRSEAGRRADRLLEFVQLDGRAHDRVDTLSGGMRRRLTIARAQVNEPEMVLLDEPTTGLDPQARHLVWERLYRLKEAGRTLLVTTHYMDEAEQLCDRLVIMDQGRIVEEGSPTELIRRHSTREVLEVRGVGDRDLDGIGDRVEVLADRILVYADDGNAARSAVHARDLAPRSMLVRRASLEDVFLHLTGRTLVE